MAFTKVRAIFMLDYIKRLSPQYSEVGATTFAFSFRIFAETDVYVKIAASSTAGTSTTLTKDTDYTVSVNLDTQETTPGGSITLIGSYAGGLEDGQVLVIGSQVPWTQTMQLTNYSRFPPEIVNTSEDRIVAQIQQLVEQQGRTVTIDETDSRSPADVLDAVFVAKDTAVQKAQEATDAANTATNKTNEVTAKYNLISPHFSAIDGVYADRANVDTVATNINNVNSVGTNIGAVNNVHSNMAVVTSVSGNATNINTVAGISSKVSTVAGISTDVEAVADNETNINTVSTNIINVNSVGGNIANVNSVAGNATNINAVNANKTNIDLVAGDKANIDAVAGDLSNIDAASGHAADAKKWAIGDPVEPTGGHSAKYYAEHMALSFKGAYSATATYATNDFVSNDESSVRAFYVSLVDSNIGNPLSDTTKWAFLFSVTSGGSIAWGNITGEITAQTDLKNALDAKADTYSLATNEDIDAIPV